MEEESQQEGGRVENFETVYVPESKIKSEPLSDEEMDTQHPGVDEFQHCVVKEEREEDEMEPDCEVIVKLEKEESEEDEMEPDCEISVKAENDVITDDEGASSSTNFDEISLQVRSQLPESSSYSKSPILCYICYKYFSEQEYRNHLLLKESIKCSICEEVFKNKYSVQHLRSHVKTNHGILPFCQYCYIFFHTTSERDEHKKSCKKCQPRENYLKSFMCHHCLKNFDLKLKLTKHLQTIHKYKVHVQRKKKIVPVPVNKSKCTAKLEKFCSELKYLNLKFTIFCPGCGVPCNIKTYFGRHIHNCMRNSVLKCPFCPLDSENVITGTLDEHILSNHIGKFSKIYVCNVCNLSFLNLDNFKMHKKSMHESIIINKVTALHVKKEEIKPKVEVKMTTYTCKICGEQIDKKLYSEHINYHVYKCPYCTLLLTSAELIKSHLGLNSDANTKCFQYFLSDPSILSKHRVKSLLNTSTRIYLDPLNKGSASFENQCDVCFQEFQFHCQLTRHQKNEKHNVDVITCMVCSEKMCTELLFNYHSSVHTKKGIQCLKCPQNFISVNKFTIHFNTKHIIKIESECQFCYKDITNENKRLKHRLKYHSDCKFHCIICDTKFKLKRDFNSHRVDEHNIYGYKCLLCESVFSDRAFSAQHICPGGEIA